MATVNGTNGADSLSGTSAADTINGLGGNDTLKGFGGADHLDGGAGIDTASYFNSAAGIGVNLATGSGFGGDAAGDTLVNIENVVGSSFNDTLIGDGNHNELVGLEGNDVLKGGGGADFLNGVDGDDILKGGGGADALFGGSGSDTADYSDSPAAVFVGLGGVASGGDAAGDTFSSIENLTGSAFDDSLGGDNGANGLSGGAGNDSLAAGGGSDFLSGGAGDDFLEGGDGNDTMIGGTGNDRYVVNAGDVVAENAGEGLDEVLTFFTYSLNAGAEIEVLRAIPESTDPIDLVGNEFNNTIVGNSNNNTIVGSPANDGGGYDGLDTMTGLRGGDVFVWTSTAESGVAGNEADVITDFNRAEGDLIAVNSIDADVTVAGNQAFTFIGTSPFTAPGQISFFTTATDTFVLFNTDGDANQEMTIRLNGAHNDVDASWFVL